MARKYPRLSPFGDLWTTNFCGRVDALLVIVTEPKVFLSLAPNKIRLQPSPGAMLAPQFPSIVKFDDGTIELITSGTLLTLRKARRGLTLGERLKRGTLEGEILVKKSV